MAKNAENPQIIVFTGPSGAGKTTLKNYVLAEIPDIEFSISCTTRGRKNGELHGVDYWFMTIGKFKEKISNFEFVEYEQVYPGIFYGTPLSEIDRITKSNGHHILMDIDVKGALVIKENYPDAKIIFINPPSLEILKDRLNSRNDGLSSAEKELRLQKASEEIRLGLEMCGKNTFDVQLNNDDLETSKKNIKNVVNLFTGKYKPGRRDMLAA